MSVPGNESEKKFWRTPELVESLLHFLDPPSILELGQVHPLTIGVMQGTSTWSRFIRRSCPFEPPAPNLQFQTSHVSFEEETEQRVIELRPILGVLQLIDSPQPHLLDLLEIICQRFPPRDWGEVARDVKVTCPNHKFHNVSALGFVLLELIEGALGTLEQKIISVCVLIIGGPLSAALKSRMIRQEEVGVKVNAYSFVCKTQDEAEILATMVQRARRLKINRLAIMGPIGEVGWAALPKALRLLPPFLLGGGAINPRGFQALVVERKFMLDGRREDVRAVWDALPGGSHVFMKRVKTTADGPLTVRLFHKATEEDWVRLEMYLDNEDALVAKNDEDEIEAQNENPEN